MDAYASDSSDSLDLARNAFDSKTSGTDSRPPRANCISSEAVCEATSNVVSGSFTISDNACLKDIMNSRNDDSSNQSVVSNGQTKDKPPNASQSAGSCTQRTAAQKPDDTLKNSSDYFSINSDDESSLSEDDHTGNVEGRLEGLNKQVHRSIRKKYLLDKFWDGKSVENWSDPESVWGVSDEKHETGQSSIGECSATASPGELSVHHMPKRLRIESPPQITSQSLMVPVNHPETAKSCLYVHHKISPYINQSAPRHRCSFPRKKVTSLQGHSGAVNRIHWCTLPQYSHLLLSVSMDQLVKVWSVFSAADHQCAQTFTRHTKAVKDGKWCSSGKRIITCGYDRYAYLFDVEKGSFHSLQPHPPPLKKKGKEIS